LFHIIFIVLVFTCAVALAQERPGVGPGGRPGIPTLPEPEQRPSPPLQPVLPPVSPLTPSETEPLPPVRVFVRQIRITGSTIFSDEELAQVTAPYVNRVLTTEDLEELRLALTRYYIDRGYITSGAIIPDQTVSEGVITLHIVEGELSRIDVAGNKWFRSGYIRKRIALGARTPVNIEALQKRLQLLQQDNRIERLNTELRPGVRRGESELNVRVQETLPFSVVSGVNNYQSPVVGAERLFVSLAHRNLTGNGDILSFTSWFGEDPRPQFVAGYSLPLTARDTTLILKYIRGETIVQEEPFDPLDIETESDTFGITLRQPLYRSLRREFAVELTGERSHSKTTLEGERFSFFFGAEDGEATIVPVRLSLEWTDRTQNQVIAARSRFSVGTDALDATTHDDSAIPDGRFFAWLGQFQWARRLDIWDIQTLFRFETQLANDSLLPLEQIGVGGRYSVRGYRWNQLVRDNGLVLQLETRVPLVSKKPWADYLQLASFADYGEAWNTDLPTPDPRSIYSIGLGLRWGITIPAPIRLRPQFEVYWGYQLKDVDTVGGDLQDHGWYFQFDIAAF
jgi:hemolysin activation/secretion protein